uniref:Galactose-3-O-sulfotransferase 4 n=1 Tax=Hypotaenidia okinawae TaxID=2861861 RepID=A0A6G1RZ84_9GRUI
MKLPPGCCRLQTLGAALGVCITISFMVQLLGGPFHRSRSPGPCQPRTHLVFLKTHKTGGSSVVNLLHRFGEAGGLRFALPHRYQFGYPNSFRAERVKGYRPGGPPFDIICHHMRFNLSEVQKVMPNDSFYFSIVRDPGTLGESAFSYYRAVAPAFRRAPSLAAFLASPHRFYRPEARGNHYARNLQWFDFGLPLPRTPGEAAAAAAALERLEGVPPPRHPPGHPA